MHLVVLANTVVFFSHLYLNLLLYDAGQLTLLSYPYPRIIDEPNMYDTIRVHAEFSTADDFTRGPEFSVCIVQILTHDLLIDLKSYYIVQVNYMLMILVFMSD